MTRSPHPTGSTETSRGGSPSSDDWVWGAASFPSAERVRILPAFLSRTLLSRFSPLSHRIDGQHSTLASLIERPTAPWPVVRVPDQLADDRIPVHVLQLLFPLLRAPHVEVIKPPLPEARQFGPGLGKPEAQLRRGRRATLPSQGPGDTLFQDLQHRRRRPIFRLADQQMDVLGHDYIAHQQKAVALAHLAERLDEQVPRSHSSKKGKAAITTERQEMEMSLSIVAFQLITHLGKPPHPLLERHKGCGTPTPTSSYHFARNCGSGILPMCEALNTRIGVNPVRHPLAPCGIGSSRTR